MEDSLALIVRLAEPERIEIRLPQIESDLQSSGGAADSRFTVPGDDLIRRIVGEYVAILSVVAWKDVVVEEG